jgi:hypothetical protein
MTVATLLFLASACCDAPVPCAESMDADAWAELREAADEVVAGFAFSRIESEHVLLTASTWPESDGSPEVEVWCGAPDEGVVEAQRLLELDLAVGGRPPELEVLRFAFGWGPRRDHGRWMSAHLSGDYAAEASAMGLVVTEGLPVELGVIAEDRVAFHIDERIENAVLTPPPGPTDTGAP